MAKESFMLVSLKEDKAKKLAQVMANPSCIKILEYLAGKDATETQVAKDLKIPLSTVHYNLQQLVDAKLVVVDEFHYSEKGREVNHYKLANKYIIIAPQEDNPNFLQHLKKYIPVTLITLGLAAVLKTMQFFTGTVSAQTSTFQAPMADAVQKQAADAGTEAVIVMNKEIAESGSAGVAQAMTADSARSAAVQNTLMQEAVNESIPAAAPSLMPSPEPIVHQPWWQSPLVDYFIAGAIFVLIVMVIIELIYYWRRKKE
jgi:DNA-binding transcriptional ArsR family regulator